MIVRWLKRFIKYTLLFVLVAMTAIAGWLGYYYVTEIRPYKPIIEEILAKADPENRNPPDNIVAMIDSEFWCEDGDGTKSMLDPHYCHSRLMKSARLSRVIPKRDEKRGLDRHLLETMMTFTLMDGLSETEKNALIAELSYVGYEKKGFNHFSKEHFNKPLSELTIEESAVVIAVLRGPSYYLPQPDLLQESANHLLQKHKLMMQETS